MELTPNERVPEPCLIINVEPRLGVAIYDVTESMCHIAKSLNVVVRLKFNDRILHATPKKTAEELCDEYLKPLIRKSKEERNFKNENRPA